MSLIQVSGVTPFTTIDYPGVLSAVVFCQGCPLRCSYCHNPHLQPCSKGTISWETVAAFLQGRKNLLDAVVFSGGEPTLQKNLDHAMQELKAMGFKIGLHTAGTHPTALSRLLPFVDWIGMDIKAPFEQYESVTGVRHSGKRARESAQTILDSGVRYEFRTTVHPDLLPPSHLDCLTQQLHNMGARHYVLQHFQPTGCLNQNIAKLAQKAVWSEFFLSQIKQRFETFCIR